MTTELSWTDEDGVKHTVGIEGATKTLARFYKEWPGGWSEVEAERNARRNVAVNSILTYNLRNTIDGKEKFLTVLKDRLTIPREPVDQYAFVASIEYLELNIEELKRILAAAEKGE